MKSVESVLAKRRGHSLIHRWCGRFHTMSSSMKVNIYHFKIFSMRYPTFVTYRLTRKPTILHAPVSSPLSLNFHSPDLIKSIALQDVRPAQLAAITVYDPAWLVFSCSITSECLFPSTLIECIGLFFISISMSPFHQVTGVKHTNIWSLLAILLQYSPILWSLTAQPFTEHTYYWIKMFYA